MGKCGPPIGSLSQGTSGPTGPREGSKAQAERPRQFYTSYSLREEKTKRKVRCQSRPSLTCWKAGGKDTKWD